MKKQSVDQKPSKTAMMAALHRSIANLDMVDHKVLDPLASHFLPALFRFLVRFRKVRTNIRNKFAKKLPGLHPYVVARTVWLDQLFQNAMANGIAQIVLLGAGYDTRAYRFGHLNAKTRIFELDVSPTQKRKIRVLRKKSFDVPDNTSLVPINFNSDSLLVTLQSAGWAKDQTSLFIWEGVSYYLEPESVDATLNFVKQYATTGSIIAFDYTIPLSEPSMDQFYGVKEFIAMMRKSHADETLKFSLNEEEMNDYLQEKGFKLTLHLNDKEIEQRFLTQKDGSTYGPVTGHFRFVVASV